MCTASIFAAVLFLQVLHQFIGHVLQHLQILCADVARLVVHHAQAAQYHTGLIAQWHSRIKAHFLMVEFLLVGKARVTRGVFYDQHIVLLHQVLAHRVFAWQARLGRLRLQWQ